MELLLNNSLTNKLENFDHDKNEPIKWYTCGPTIYDSAHMGHARTFMTFDIIRRVLTYLGYNITYVMNITDIDDKIINKVKEQSHDNIVSMENYSKFIKSMEKDFWEDMDNLNILRPTVTTRVTEYIEPMIKYIEIIDKNDMCYPLHGSVYLDSAKFKDKNFKLDIFNRGNETEFTTCEFSSEKKNNGDFALWKAYKEGEGEIWYNSKWGKGRPGWHLECSVMSHFILGYKIDIHSGGIDLIHPHHTNEILQTMAHSNCKDIPIKLFLHSGHLNIDGTKMSKSLKNFITIKDYLQNIGTQQQLRLLFLTHSWYKSMDFSSNSLENTKKIEKTIKDFYSNMESLFRTGNFTSTNYDEKERQLNESFLKIERNVEKNLYNNIETKLVIEELLSGINITYKYLENNKDPVNLNIVKHFFDFMNKIFNMLGIDFLINKNIKNDSEKFITLLVGQREEIRNFIKENREIIPPELLSKLFGMVDDLRAKLKPFISIKDRK